MRLYKKREHEPKKQFTKNEAINETLNNTTPFTPAQRKGGVEQTSVLDKFQQRPVNENMDKTVTFNQQGLIQDYKV